MKAYEILKASEEYRIFLAEVSQYVQASGFETLEEAQEAGFLFDEFLREVHAR